MTHFVIASDCSGNITALQSLPPRWRFGKHTYSLVKENTVSVSAGLPIASCDLEIKANHANSYFRLGALVVDMSYLRRVDFVRQCKSIQTALFNSTAAKLKLKHHRHLNCWQHAADVAFDQHGLFLVRPEAGARGIGQVVFHSKEITPVALDVIISQVYSSTNEKSQEVTPRIETEPVEDVLETSSDKEQKFTKALWHRAPSAVFSSSRDRMQDEGLMVLFSARCFSEYVTDIKQEFRLLTGATGQVCYVLERDRKVVGSLYNTNVAIGCGNEESADAALVALEQINGMSVVVCNEIRAMLKELNAPLQSFDLYLTHSGKWGFWETSPEFGCEAVPPYIVKEEAMRFIENVCATI